jgi:hypothetical protein
VAGCGLVVGDVSKEVPHGLIFARNGPLMLGSTNEAKASLPQITQGSTICSRDSIRQSVEVVLKCSPVSLVHHRKHSVSAQTVQRVHSYALFRRGLRSSSSQR